MKMSIFGLKTNDLSWQDRTINIEFMIAPHKSQLLYNKHKGLKTKYDQEFSNLEREKDSFLKAFKTEQRLMERRKDKYSKRRNDIIMRRSSGDIRRRWSISGRISAPPCLGQDVSKDGGTFITEVRIRESKSAGARMNNDERASLLKQSQWTVEPANVVTHQLRQTPELSQLPRKTSEPTSMFPAITPDIRTVSPCISTRANTPGKPYLTREKSVRFLISDRIPCKDVVEKATEPVALDERLNRFLKKQINFNTAGLTTARSPLQAFDDVDAPQKTSEKRSSGLDFTVCKLESAFDEFCIDGSSEGLNKLVKYATKVKACARNAKNSEIIST